VEENDSNRTVRDFLQAAPDRLRFLGCLGVHAPKQRFAEIGERRSGETADEPFRPDDADFLSGKVEDDGGAVEHVYPGTGEHARNLGASAGVKVVIAENGADGNPEPAAGVRQNLRLSRVSVSGEIAGEQDEICLAFDCGKRLLDPRARRLGSVDVTRRGNPDHAPNVPRRGETGNRAAVAIDQDREFELLLEAMKKAGGALNDAGIPFVLGGGLACWARGAPKTEHDVDFLVKPEDAKRAQKALGEIGMRVEKPPEGWLLKAYDGDVLIDLIFDPQDGPVDAETFTRAEELEVYAMRMHVASLEDVLVQKLLALTEQDPDYSSVLELARSLREQVDWNDVRTRTKDSAFAAAYFTLLDELEIVGD
jgi:predicted nucleotidyltransferase